MGETEKNTLSMAEKNAIKKALGNMESCLSSLVVCKLYLALPNSKWTDTNVWGAALLVVDRSQQPSSFYVKVVDIKTFEQTFVHELYKDMVYDCSQPLFHSFEAQNCLVGLSFCNALSAGDFGESVTKNIPLSPKLSTKDKIFKMWGSAKKKIIKSSNKTEVKISVPTNFKHESHLGYDEDVGFKLESISDEWKGFFKASGIKAKQMKDQKQAKVIFDTMAANLGDNFLEKAVPELPLGAAPPPVPSKASKPLPSTPAVPPAQPAIPSAQPAIPPAQPSVPPKVPAIPPTTQPATPPVAPTKPATATPPIPTKPSKPAVPTKPTAAVVPPEAASEAPQQTTSAPPTAPAMSAAPTAPPMAPAMSAAPKAPPMAPALGGAPTAPPMAPALGGVPSAPPMAPKIGGKPSANALGAVKLKKAAPKPKPAASSGMGGGLLDAIRNNGLKLKKVERQHERKQTLDTNQTASLMNTLQSAMSNRFAAVAAEDDEDDSDDDWD